MYLIRLLLTSFLLVLAQPVLAGDTILFQDIPKWVKVVDMDATLADESSPDAMFVILDKQIKLEGGETHVYSDIAMRAISADTLPAIGNLIRSSWHPGQGDLIVHRLEIRRGDETVLPLENGFKFETIRREKQLEQYQLNGVLTATSQLEDIQLGDIVRFSVSVTRRNPALGSKMEYSSKLLVQPWVDWENRLRMIWPKSEKMQWKISLEDHPSELTQIGQYNELTMAINAEKPKDMPKDAPNRFRINPFVDMTGFASWAEVSARVAELYQTDGSIAEGGLLMQEVDAIAAKTDDQMQRTALAVQLVQDKVRYLYNGLGFGNYVPQTPEETWKLRYGDCKAKTLLLMAILHRLGVDAEAALVHTNWRDGVTERLPGFQAFNHIIVRAEIAGEILWLDGTGTGTRIDDLKDVPGHRYALPVRAKNGDLEAMNIRRMGRPYNDIAVTYDLSAGTAFPALVDLRAVIRTSDARNLNAQKSQLTSDEFQEKLDAEAAKHIVGSLVTDSSFAYDADRGEAIITASGISYLDWKTRRKAKRHEFWNVMGKFAIEAERNTPETREIPVNVDYPGFFRERATFRLPTHLLPEGSPGFSIAGKANLEENLAGYSVSRTTDIKGDLLRFNESYYVSQWEIAADQLALEKKKLAAAKKRKVTLVAPQDLPDDWQQIERGLADGKVDRLIAAFDQLVEHNPDDSNVLQQRAWIYQHLGKYDQAIADLERALAVEPDADVLNWRAELLMGTDPKAAIADLEKALEIDPAHKDATAELVNIHILAGRSKKAEKTLATARAKGLSDEEADKLLALIWQSDNRAEDADALLTSLIDDDPESLSLLNERCWLRGRSNFKLEEALEDCTEAVELAQSPAMYLDSRSLIYYRLGRYDEALADINRALRLSPNMSSSRYMRALTHVAKGDHQRAEQDYKAAVALYKFVDLTYDRFGLGFAAAGQD